MFVAENQLNPARYLRRLEERGGDAARGLLLSKIMMSRFEFLWRYRVMEHYFLSPGVASFCAGSIKEYSRDYLRRLPECADCSYPASSGRGEVKMQGCFAIHFPIRERDRSVLVMPSTSVLVPTRFYPDGTYEAKPQVFDFSASDGNYLGMVDVSEGPVGQESGEGDYLLRLVFGLSLYMDAFPDTVVAAQADSVHNQKHYSGGRHIVSRNETVDSELVRGVSPHFRVGHFRTLRAERFVRKKGQTIFVPGCYVRGKALDVLDDAPPLECAVSN